MYPTLVELCGLEEDEELDGVSLARVLRDPASATDRSVILPGMRPNEFAIINQDWRYIRYEDGGEELYDLRSDPNEWHNLASAAGYEEIKNRLRQAEPKEFAVPGPTKKGLRLVTQGESFSWAPRKSKSR